MLKKAIAVLVAVVAMLSAMTQQINDPEKGLRAELAASKPDTSRIRMLIGLAVYYYEYKSGLDSYLDSINAFKKQARQLNETYRIVKFNNQLIFLDAVVYMTEHPDADRKALFLPVIDSCRRTKDVFNEAETWANLAALVGDGPRLLPYRISCLQNSIVLYRQLNEKTLEMNALRFIADMHFQQRKFREAESELLQILTEEKSITSRSVLFTYDLLAAVYLATGEYDKALSYGLKTQVLMGQTGDSAYASPFCFRLATVYKALGKPRQQVEWAKNALNSIGDNSFGNAFNSIRFISTILLDDNRPAEALQFVKEEMAKRKPRTIGDRRLVQQSLASCYTALKRYDEAERSFFELIRLGNEQGFDYTPVEKGLDNFITGKFYFTKGDYNKAGQFLNIALESYGQTGKLDDIKNAHLWLFKVDSAKGNYLSAVNHLQQKEQLQDSAFTVERNQQVEELQIIYETDKKEQDIKILEGRESLAKAEVKQIRISRNWMIAGACMLLVIAGLLYRQSRLRKRNNQVIASKNEQLQHLLSEKEWLVKEIHHRVKNNFQSVMSLLGTQSAYLKTDEAINAINESQQRIQAMSLIHQRLYQSNNLSAIGMNDYIRELVDSLNDSYNDSNRVKFILDIEPVAMDLAHCIPLGLILNEAITNSFKYAFPDRRGLINITLKSRGTDQFFLSIRDNGVGLPAGFNLDHSDSMGMNLMRGLCEELGAQFSIREQQGTQIDIQFANVPDEAIRFTNVEAKRVNNQA
jgi:two-component sensor histidine kinase